MTSLNQFNSPNEASLDRMNSIVIKNSFDLIDDEIFWYKVN